MEPVHQLMEKSKLTVIFFTFRQDFDTYIQTIISIVLLIFYLMVGSQ